MKNFLLAAACIIGVQSSSIAQDSTATVTVKPEPKTTFYVAVGATFNGDYKINEKLKSSGISQLADATPEISVGYNVMGSKFLLDMELNTNYLLSKLGDNRLSTTTTGFKLRGHYIPLRRESYFVSGGLDVSYLVNTLDIHNKYNAVDLNDLNPLNTVGHISLYNELMYVGPSVSLGLFQNTSFPIRVNAGYEWALTNGYWKSDYADVYNSVKESGHSRFYTKLTWNF